MSVDNSLTNTKVVLMLIRVARAAFHAADDSEQVQVEDGLAHVVNSQDFDELSNALDALEELPDDQPGYIMHGPAKAEWALRALLAAAPQPVGDIKDAAPELQRNWLDLITFGIDGAQRTGATPADIIAYLEHALTPLRNRAADLSARDPYEQTDHTARHTDVASREV